MMRYIVRYLQAVEPEHLPEKPEGIEVNVVETHDEMGFPRVDVSGPSREVLIEYVRVGWGDDDADWFKEWVEDRVEVVKGPRTVLVHLNVEVPPNDDRSGDEVADFVLAAVEVGLEGAPGDLASGSELTTKSGLVVCAPLVEEV